MPNTTNQQREQAAKKIQETYTARDRTLLAQGRLVHDTEKGIWGPASVANCAKLFEKIKLNRYTSFIDIGCGDGRVTLLASLYTKADGIEYDRELVEIGKKIQQEINLPKATLLQGDFFEHDLSSYDVVFINPDTGFQNKVEEKLLKELRGLLLVYNEVFLPRLLTRGQRHWIGGIPITEYTNPERDQAAKRN